MSDMLVKLYELPDDWSFLEKQGQIGIIIRKPIGGEKHVVVDWVRDRFSDCWASEADVAISNSPRSCFIAIADKEIVGFACYDATALGFFGPIGMDESYRGQGTGKALLRACLLDMKLKGYGYAIIGATGIFEFYGKAVGAIEIPDSWPGVYKTWIKRD